MISHGDEIARSQRGNNNAYCQDSEVTWVDWRLDDRRRGLLAFARQVFALRQANPLLRRRTFFRGQSDAPDRPKDVTWLRDDGHEMTDVDWNDPHRFAFGMLLDGRAATELDEHNQPITGDTLVLALNNGMVPVRFTLPTVDGEGVWVPLVDSANLALLLTIEAGWILLAPHSLVLLRYGRDRRRHEAMSNH